VARRLGELVRLSYKPAAPTVPASGGSESGARKLPDERGIFEKLDAVLATMRTATPLQFEADLCAAALRGVLGDPADVGLALLAAHLQQRCGRLALARAARGLALFLEPDLVLKGSIESLGGTISPSRPPGARRWPSIPCATGPCAACCARWRPPWLRYPVRGRSRRRDAAPAQGRGCLPRAARPTRGSGSASRGAGHGGDVTFAATQPLTVVMDSGPRNWMTPSCASSSGARWSRPRAGTLAVARLSVDNLRGLLRG